MSRCRQTDALLDATFAGVDLTRAQAAHAAHCTECARALSQARRFDADLGRIGLELTPDEMPSSVGQTEFTPSIRREGRAVSVTRGIVASSVAAAVLGLAVFVGAQWLIQAGPESWLVPGLSVDDAASLVGVERGDVLLTEDGALAIRDLGMTLELVMVRQTGEGPERYVVDTTAKTATPTTFSTVTCVEDDVLRRTEYVWGRWEAPERVTGPGESLIGEDGHVIFAFDPNASMTDSLMVIFERDGSSQFAPIEAPIREECLSVVAEQHAEVQRARDLRCGHWGGLDEGAQHAVTEALVGDDLLPAVRERQQLALAAGRDELVAAARGSIDKACQVEDRAVPLREIVASLYGRAAP